MTTGEISPPPEGIQRSGMGRSSLLILHARRSILHAATRAEDAFCMWRAWHGNSVPHRSFSLVATADSGVPRTNQGVRSMTAKTIKIPSAEHPITIEANPARVVVTVGDRVIADARNALTLREASYPP